MIAWPDADPRGPNGERRAFGSHLRIPLGNLAGGHSGHAPSPKTREGIDHRAVVWMPTVDGVAATGVHVVVLWFHGWGVGVRARPAVTDVEFYALPAQLQRVPQCAVVLPQGGLQGVFGTAASDPIGYLEEIERTIGTTFNRVVVAAHSGGGEAALQVLPRLGNRLAGVLLFEAINGDGQAKRFAHWATTHSTPMRAVYGTSGFYTERHRKLTTQLAACAHVRLVPVRASHNRVMAVDNVFATMLAEVINGPAI